MTRRLGLSADSSPQIMDNLATGVKYAKIPNLTTKYTEENLERIMSTFHNLLQFWSLYSKETEKAKKLSKLRNGVGSCV